MNNKILFITGPCVIESRAFLHECAEYLSNTFKQKDADFVFKSSFYKANRTSHASFRGPGIEEGLDILHEIKEKYKLRIITDIHESWQAKLAADVADIIQIPARLCQQTDLIEAAAATGKPINFKKGQFLSPYDMSFVVEKARHTSQLHRHNDQIYFVTERGTFFGENKLVVDMRSLRIMKKHTQCQVLFDASHSIQLPGGLSGTSGGEIEYLPDLACAAVATGNISGVYFESHPDPINARCDGPIQLPFSQVPEFIQRIIALNNCVQSTVTNQQLTNQR